MYYVTYEIQFSDPDKVILYGTPISSCSKMFLNAPYVPSVLWQLPF
jgi:hypothetical protein